MTFEEALIHLKDKKCIKRRCWLSPYWLKIHDKMIVQYNDVNFPKILNEMAMLDGMDLLANDWEIVE